jgi:hypothetical protein
MFVGGLGLLFAMENGFVSRIPCIIRAFAAVAYAVFSGIFDFFAK